MFSRLEVNNGSLVAGRAARAFDTNKNASYSKQRINHKRFLRVMPIPCHAKRTTYAVSSARCIACENRQSKLPSWHPLEDWVATGPLNRSPTSRYETLQHLAPLLTISYSSCFYLRSHFVSFPNPSTHLSCRPRQTTFHTLQPFTRPVKRYSGRSDHYLTRLNRTSTLVESFVSI